MKPTAQNFLIAILPAVLTVFVIFFLIMPQVRENREKDSQISVTNFIECAAAGNPVMESYPRQCRHGEQTFIEDIGQIVGGDKDEHGCLGPAGYSWCEPKNKCLRIWEETCFDGVEQEIQYFLASKYDKAVEEVRINITKQTENHVSGSVRFSPESSAGGVFLAVRSGNIWEVVYDGNGSVDCEKMRTEYDFPDTILKPNFCD